MAEWIDVKDRLPEENIGELQFTDGKREFEGYYKNRRFIQELPVDSESGRVTEWSPEGIVSWRRVAKEDD
jgi:hypothetical protein